MVVTKAPPLRTPQKGGVRRGEYSSDNLKTVFEIQFQSLTADQSKCNVFKHCFNFYQLLMIFCLSFAPMQGCERFGSANIQDQDGDIWAVIHTVMDFTVVPERLQSSFGLLRMSHLLQ